MITVQATIKASLEKVWQLWTQPEHITQWNNATDDWYTPKAANDLKVGGKFNYTMASRDSQRSFDFEGTYTEVKDHSLLKYNIIDGRKVSITFEATPNGVVVTESFEMENVHSEELQRQGWQSILNNFKKYAER